MKRATSLTILTVYEMKTLLLFYFFILRVFAKNDKILLTGVRSIRGSIIALDTTYAGKRKKNTDINVCVFNSPLKINETFCFEWGGCRC